MELKLFSFGKFDRHVFFHFFGALVFWVALIKGGAPLLETNFTVMYSAFVFEMGQRQMEWYLVIPSILLTTVVLSILFSWWWLLLLFAVPFYFIGWADSDPPQPIEWIDLIAAGVPCLLCSLFLTFYGG